MNVYFNLLFYVLQQTLENHFQFFFFFFSFFLVSRVQAKDIKIDCSYSF